jgi:hypothetical protein
MVFMVLFWVLLILTAVGGFWYWRVQPWLPGLGVVLVLLALLGWKVYPPG